MTTPSPEQRDPGWLKKQLDAAVAEVATWHPGMRRAYDGMTVEQIREAEKKRMAEPLTDERIKWLKHEASQLGLLPRSQVNELIAALQEARRGRTEMAIALGEAGRAIAHAERTAADKSAECERLRMTVYAWLGTFRDEMPARQVMTLQDILGPLSPTPDTFTSPQGRLIENE